MALALTACCCTAAAVENADTQRNWHQWRGPNATGVAPHGDPPLEWSGQKNVRWKVAVPGKGSASPIVWNDRIFIASAVPAGQPGEAADAGEAADERRGGGRRGGRGGRSAGGVHRFILACYDRETGRQLWQRTAVETAPHEGGHETNTHASGSPITDGQRVYVSFGSRGVYAFDMDGNPQWKRELGTMQTRNNFGEGSSAALYKDTLVVPFDHEGDSFIAALDAATGEVRWKTARDEPTTWATPLIVEHDGRVQVVTNGTNRVRGYDLATGELLWACGGQATNPIACPVTLDGLVYCMTGYRGYAAYAIPLSSTGDITGTDRVAWKRTDAGPYIASPLLYDGRLYYTKDRHAVLMVTDAKSGKPIIDAERLPELGILYSSPVAAAGRIYITDRDGVTMVIEPGDSLKVLAMNRLGEGVDATPAIVGRQMFMRGQGHLYCIEQR